MSPAQTSDRVKGNDMKRFAMLLFLVIGLGLASAAPWRGAKDRSVKCTSEDCFPVVPQVVVGEKPLARVSPAEL